MSSFRVVKQTTWHPAKMKEVTYHPACTKPDVQSEADYARLLEDVKSNGIRHPILVQEGSGAVVAGRHRIKAGREAGVPIPVEIIEISDPECWSLSRSELCHRNMTPARAAVLYLEMKDEEDKAMRAANAAPEEEDAPDADDDAPPSDDGDEKPQINTPFVRLLIGSKKAKKKEKKRAKAGEGKKAKKEAKEAGVSTALMERVKRVKEKGIPALWKAMDAEIVSANDANFIVEFDHDTQKAAVALVKNGECKTLKAAKARLDKEAKEAAGPVLKDGKGKEVPKRLLGVFEDREQFAILREQLKDYAGGFKKLLKKQSAKHIPKELATHLDDIVQALDLYQPFAVADDTEDGWVTKRTAQGK